MDKKFKCKDCEFEIKAAEAPTSCGCKGTGGFEEVKSVVEVATLEKSTVDQLMKSLHDLSADMKEQKEKGTVAEERMLKYEDEVSKQLELQKQSVGRKTGTVDDNITELLKLKDFKGFTINEIIDTKSSDRLINDLQYKNDELYITAQLLRKPVTELKAYDKFKKTALYKETKAMFDSAAVGAEWVPIGFSSQLIDEVRLNLVVASLHPELTMSTKSLEIPSFITRLKAYRATGAQAGSDAPAKFRASTLGTGEVILNAELIAVRTVFDAELEEDAIIALVPVLRREIGRAIADAIENTILNGDTDGTLDTTDMHGDSIDGESPTKLWDGYRELAKDINNGGAGSGSGVTDAGGAFATSGSTLRNARAKMLKYAVNPRDLNIVTGIRGYLQEMLQLNDVRTIDLFGDKAIIKTGELAKFDNTSIIISEHQRADLSGSGVSGGATSTNVDSAIQYVNGRSFVFGNRRQMTLESRKIAGTDSWEMWATFRGDFQPLYASSQTYVHNIVDFY